MRQAPRNPGVFPEQRGPFRAVPALVDVVGRAPRERREESGVAGEAWAGSAYPRRGWGISKVARRPSSRVKGGRHPSRFVTLLVSA